MLRAISSRLMASASRTAADANRQMRIYTRTGDGGSSSLYTGERRPKSDEVFHALGNIDELNSYLGLANHSLQQIRVDGDDEVLRDLIATLANTQSILLDVGSSVATPTSGATERQAARAAFDSSRLTERLEREIDAMTARLPPLKRFILPGGNAASCQLHVCRSVCRRAERSLEPLLSSGQLDAGVARYVNRLSDYFFTAARYACAAEGVEEVTYKKPKE